MKEKKEITIYDIATHLNIAASTVSRALQGSDLVKESTRNKVIAVSKKMGYQANTFASNLRNKKTKTLGVIVHRLNTHFMATVLDAMEQVATQEGYTLIISQSQEDKNREIQNVETMFHKRVDGLMLSLSCNTDNTNHIMPFIKKNIPVIFFDRLLYDDTTKVMHISINNYEAGYKVTKHLLSMGCKRIMYVSGGGTKNIYTERECGYKKALEEHKIIFDEQLIYKSNLTEEAGEELALYILSLDVKHRPDAVFAVNDTVAVYCMKKLKEAGIQIPAEIAFVGFNNQPISRIAEPKLSTIDYPGQTLGKMTAEYMIKIIKENIKMKTNIIMLSPELVVRESSKRK